jgi:hypothetical protein
MIHFDDTSLWQEKQENVKCILGKCKVTIRYLRELFVARLVTDSHCELTSEMCAVTCFEDSDQ